MTAKKTIICLMGPTGIGKSDVALQLSKQFPIEIISVDSAMVYRGMDIGTAKPSPEELALVPHHLIDILDPKDSYSAAQFCDDALSCIEEILLRNRIPLLVGGTMLYYRALQDGLSPLPKAEPEIREQLEREAQEQGLTWLHDRLMKIDPTSGQRIKPNDIQRIIRALEVYYLTGKTLTENCAVSNKKCEYDFLNIGLLSENRHALHERIAIRFESMLKRGFIAEVESLYSRADLHPGLPAIRAVGYRQAWSYLSGEMDFTEMQARCVYATRQLAKRQFTWLRKWPGLYRIDADTPDVIQDISEQICRIGYA